MERVTRRVRLPRLLAAGAAALALAQLAWAWRACSRVLTYDAMSYVGAARHILDGDFRASVICHWSPLISWLIALACAVVNSRALAVAKGVTIATYLCCLPLLYSLVLRLSKNARAAALALLWFCATWEVARFSVFWIGADYLLTALTLVYFHALLSCLRRGRRRDWLLLGAAHAAAFLAKAFALPWLTLTTLAAAGLLRTDAKKRALAAALGLLLPALAWLGWGLTLEAKYGIFMSGCQAKQTLIERRPDFAGARPSALEDLHDCSQADVNRWDRYVVFDPLPAGSSAWGREIPLSALAGQMADNARRLLPRALLSLLLLATPVGLALLALRARRAPEKDGARAFARLALLSCASLVCAYPLIGWYHRYALPALPLVLAVAAPALLERRAALGLAAVCAAVPWLGFYPSAFNAYDDATQAFVRDAAGKLRGDVVVIGSGPYPNYEIGYQAGLMSAFLAGARVVGYQPGLLDGRQAALARDVAKLRPADVLVLGDPRSPVVRDLRGELSASGYEPRAEVEDPARGPVGLVLSRRP